jgi:hypothetical protein
MLPLLLSLLPPLLLPLLPLVKNPLLAAAQVLGYQRLSNLAHQAAYCFGQSLQ